MKALTKLLAAGAVALLATGAVAMSTAASAATVVSSSAPAPAATSDYYLKIEGIDGEIEIQSFSWGVSSPRDLATGQASGKRQYQPLVIRKTLDKSSPLLFKAADGGTHIKNVTLFKKASDGGKEQLTVVFQDVLISAFQQSGDAGSNPTESVSFTFQKIEWK